MTQRIISQEKMEFAESFPFGVIWLSADRSILWMNQFACEKLYCEREKVFLAKWNDVFPNLLAEEVKNGTDEMLKFTFGGHSFIAQLSDFGENDNDLLFMFHDMKRFEELVQELDSYKNSDMDLKAIFDISYDVIYVSDGKGVTLRVSSASERLWGYKESELVGKSVYQLEKEGVYSPSITRLVMEKKEKISMTQTTKTGRRLMVVGIPIMDEQGEIVRIVNASRDITEVSKLKSELIMMKQLTEGYRHELMNLRMKNDIENKLIYRSEEMKRMILLAEKISKVDSAVLLIGESGVGKEQVATFIHNWSERENGPFIQVNCGAIPENVLQSELFGYSDKGAGERDGNLGSLDLANGGTLFLEDIEKLSLSLQYKIFLAIQEKNGLTGDISHEKKADFRIIASTSENLDAKVKEGTFRKDLYYLLNVVPIVIPPLRERKEDVVPLLLHFASRINKKYNINKKFNPKLLKTLQEYAWPGNVRELQNIVERLLVIVDGDWIEEEHLPDYMVPNLVNQKAIQVNRIIPLKEATEMLEKELLSLAQKKYVSTTKMAEVLGVNQSTVSRKLQQYNL